MRRAGAGNRVGYQCRLEDGMAGSPAGEASVSYESQLPAESRPPRPGPAPAGSAPWTSLLSQASGSGAISGNPPHGAHRDGPPSLGPSARPRPPGTWPATVFRCARNLRGRGERGEGCGCAGSRGGDVGELPRIRWWRPSNATRAIKVHGTEYVRTCAHTRTHTRK